MATKVVRKWVDEDGIEWEELDNGRKMWTMLKGKQDENSNTFKIVPDEAYEKCLAARCRRLGWPTDHLKI